MNGVGGGKEWGDLTGCCSMMPLGLTTPMGSITAGCCADIFLTLHFQLLEWICSNAYDCSPIHTGCVGFGSVNAGRNVNDCFGCNFLSKYFIG